MVPWACIKNISQKTLKNAMKQQCAMLSTVPIHQQTQTRISWLNCTGERKISDTIRIFLCKKYLYLRSFLIK